MSIQSEIDRISNNVNNALSTIAETGVEVGQGSDALPAAAAALANEKADKVHDHEAADVIFTDGDTLQEKYDAGDLGSDEIYYGSGEPPASAKVQIDPSGGYTFVYDPVAKTDEMVNPVGVDSQGRLFSAGPSEIEYDDNVICQLLAASWQGNGPYTQTVSVEGMSATWIPKNPHYVVGSTDSETEAIKTAFEYITSIDSVDGALIFECTANKPEVDITVLVPGIPDAGDYNTQIVNGGSVVESGEAGWIPPVGFIWTSTEDVSPASLFAETTWERIKDRFILAAGDTYTAGSTGGNAEIALTMDNLPKTVVYDVSSYASSALFAVHYTTSTGYYAMNNVNGGYNTNIMNPYYTAYCWRRTA